MNTRYRNSCTGVFNMTMEELKVICEDPEQKFIYFLKAQSELTGKRLFHLQLYVEFTKQYSCRQIKKLFKNNGFNCEARKGTQEQAIHYCSREFAEDGSRKRIEGTEVYTYGSRKSQGKRSDISQVINDCKEGKRLTDIIDDLECPSYQSIKCAQLLKGIFSKPRDTKPYVMWIYGETGTGKTRYVFDNYKDIYIKNSTKWWDGYDGHEVILIDDYRRDFMKFHELLTLTDRYPCRREFKARSSTEPSP